MSTTDKPTVETAYPLSYHLRELRKRIVYTFFSILILFILCYWKSEYIYNFVIRPVSPLLTDNVQLAMLTLTEGFLTELKMCMLGAIFLSTPFILVQLWLFVAPGLYKEERRYLVGFVFFASVLFLLGAAFAYYVVFPLGVKFLTSFGTKWGLNVNLTISGYLSFVMRILIAFGMSFELPVVVFFLTKIGIVNVDMLKKYRKFAIVGIFILAAVITPPDVISQLLMAAPLLILYEISIWIAKVFGPKQEIADKAADIYE